MPQTAMTATGLLHVDDVAAELNTTDVAVVRLIARRRLKANAVRENPSPSDWRFTPATLVAYVTRGTPDLKMPPLRDEWFDIEKLHVAYGLRRAVENSAAAQFLDDKAAAKFANQRENRQSNGFEREITLTSAVRAAIDAATPISDSYPSRPMTDPPFSTWGETYLGKLMHTEIRKALEPQALRPTPRTPLLWRFYQTPDAYERRIREALDTVAARRLVFQRGHQIAPSRRITIDYFLPYTSIRSRQQMNALAEIAF